MAFSRDPALAIWQAMKPLAEVGARTDAPDIAKIVTEAEIILFGLADPPKLGVGADPLASTLVVEFSGGSAV